MSTMIEANTAKDVFANQFGLLEKQEVGQAPSWLLPIRNAAIARFTELGFPSTKHEDWKYTNVRDIADNQFAGGADANVDVTAETIAPYVFASDTTILLVCVNGVFRPDLSNRADVPGDITVCPLAEAINKHGDVLERHFARHLSFEDQAFAALNTALATDGVFLHVPAGKVVDKPVHVLHIAAAGTNGANVSSMPRSLVLAEANSEVSIAETYVSLGDSLVFTNAATELIAGDNATLRHYKSTHECGDGRHIASLQFVLGRGAHLISHAITLGEGMVRNNLSARFAGEGGNCELFGGYMVDDSQHVDNFLIVDHAVPHCDSREFFKGVLDGTGRGIFSGRIIVREDAQKTDAKQTNMTLPLSDACQVESKPQLEIYADDVKCTHGATIGQVEGEAMFYLQSRGLSADAARSLLVYAFARESIEGIRIDGLKDRLEQLLFDRLPGSRVLRR